MDAAKETTRDATQKYVMSSFSLGFVVLSLGLTTACSEDNLPKYNQLGGLRVLALQAGADGADCEAAPSTSVSITPYVSDYKGGSRTVSYTAVACLDRGVTAGAEPTCEGVPGAVTVGSAPLTFSTPERTEPVTSFSVNIPADTLIFAARSSPDRYNGVNYLVTYQLTASDGATVKSFKRIVVSDSTKAAKNKNPSWNAVNADGSPITTVPSSEVQLSTSSTAGSAESYSVMKSDLSLSSEIEELTTTWFITDGSLKYLRTLGDQSTKFTPPSPMPSDHTPVIVGVLRDGRGGIAVRRVR